MIKDKIEWIDRSAIVLSVDYAGRPSDVPIVFFLAAAFHRVSATTD